MYFRDGGRDERERYQYNYNTVLTYLSAKCQNKQISDFFQKNKFNRIAVYGIEDVGKCLINDLVNSGIKIEYIIDPAFKSYPTGYNSIPVIGIEEILTQHNLDVFVITTLFELNEIIDLLLSKNIALEKIINITDVVYSL